MDRQAQARYQAYGCERDETHSKDRPVGPVRASAEEARNDALMHSGLKSVRLHTPNVYRGPVVWTCTWGWV